MKIIGYNNLNWRQCSKCKYWADNYGCTINDDVIEEYWKIDRGDIICTYEDEVK